MAVGLFITRDTDLSQPAYQYCNDDPVNKIDPSGHEESSLEKTAGGAWDVFWVGVGGRVGGTIGGVPGGLLGGVVGYVFGEQSKVFICWAYGYYVNAANQGWENEYNDLTGPPGLGLPWYNSGGDPIGYDGKPVPQ